MAGQSIPIFENKFNILLIFSGGFLFPGPYILTRIALIISPGFRMFERMKIFNLLFCIFFILFAALQYNDPDPYIWIPLYMYSAVLCWLAFRGKYFRMAYLAGVIVYAVYAGYKIFDENGVWDWITKHRAENITGTMKATQPWIEETREFFGLVILIAVLLIDYFHARKIARH